MDVGYYTPAARTTLNPAVFIVFLSEIDLRPATPRVYTLGARAGAFRHPAVVSSTTTLSYSFGTETYLFFWGVVTKSDSGCLSIRWLIHTVSASLDAIACLYRVVCVSD